MKAPRFFVLTAGASVEDAIDFVEARGHRIRAVALTGADSVKVYGIAEIFEPGPLDRRIAQMVAEAAHADGLHDLEPRGNCPRCLASLAS